MMFAISTQPSMTVKWCNVLQSIQYHPNSTIELRGCQLVPANTRHSLSHTQIHQKATAKVKFHVFLNTVLTQVLASTCFCLTKVNTRGVIYK